MRRISFLHIVLLVLIFFSACTSTEPEAPQECTHIGVVIDDNTDLPIPKLDVIITDGNNIHAKTLTKEDGSFSIVIKPDQLTSNAYYMLVGNEHTEKKEIPLRGFGNTTYDDGIIRIKGATIPVVRTRETQEVTSSSAICGGEVTSSGGYDVYQRGICYSTSPSPSLQDAHTSDGKGTGVFTSTLSDLTNNVTYYVRAYAINDVGVAYGNEISFRTEEGLPSVTTSTISEITSYTIKCGGEVTDEGGASILMRGVCWSTDNSMPTIHDNKTENGDGRGSYNSVIEGINVTQHQYYIRAYATNRYGTAYGEVVVQKNVNPFGLPIVDMDGWGNLVYMVLPYDIAAKTWEDANYAVNNLEAYGYDDWLIPITSIYEKIYAQKDEIGGFQNKKYWTSETAGCDMDLWECYFYIYDFGTGSEGKDNVFNLNPSRPIRSINFKSGF